MKTCEDEYKLSTTANRIFRGAPNMEGPAFSHRSELSLLPWYRSGGSVEDRSSSDTLPSSKSSEIHGQDKG